jgi:hypothetical protein
MDLEERSCDERDRPRRRLERLFAVSVGVACAVAACTLPAGQEGDGTVGRATMPWNGNGNGNDNGNGNGNDDGPGEQDAGPGTGGAPSQAEGEVYEDTDGNDPTRFGATIVYDNDGGTCGQGGFAFVPDECVGYDGLREHFSEEGGGKGCAELDVGLPYAMHDCQALCIQQHGPDWSGFCVTEPRCLTPKEEDGKFLDPAQWDVLPTFADGKCLYGILPLELGRCSCWTTV